MYCLRLLTCLSVTRIIQKVMVEFYETLEKGNNQLDHERCPVCICVLVSYFNWDIRTVTHQDVFLLRLTISRAHQNCRATDHYYSNTVTGTLAVDGWAISLVYSLEGPGRAAAPSSPLFGPRCTKCNSPPINGQCVNFILLHVPITGLTLVSLGRSLHSLNAF